MTTTQSHENRVTVILKFPELEKLHRACNWCAVGKLELPNRGSILPNVYQSPPTNVKRTGCFALPLFVLMFISLFRFCLVVLTFNTLFLQVYVGKTTTVVASDDFCGVYLKGWSFFFFFFKCHNDCTRFRGFNEMQMI